MGYPIPSKKLKESDMALKIYPTMSEFNKAYGKHEVQDGNVIKVDSGDQQCVGIFKRVRSRCMDSKWATKNDPNQNWQWLFKLWNLDIEPKFWVKGKEATPATGDSPDFTIVSPFLRGVKVLASDNNSWDKKSGLIEEEHKSTECASPRTAGSPRKRTPSQEEISRSSLSRHSSGCSIPPVSPINQSELQELHKRRNSTEATPPDLSRHASNNSSSGSSSPTNLGEVRGKPKPRQRTPQDSLENSIELQEPRAVYTPNEQPIFFSASKPFTISSSSSEKAKRT